MKQKLFGSLAGILVVFALSIASPSPAFADIVIDDLTKFQLLQLDGAFGAVSGPISSSVADAGIVGGTRDATLDGTASNKGLIRFIVGSGNADYQTGSDDFGSFEVVYDGNGSGLGDALEDHEMIKIGFDEFDIGQAASADFTVTADDGTNSVSLTETLTVDNFVPFNLLYNFLNLGVDFESLESITVDFESFPTNEDGGDVDFQITMINALVIPEPSSLAVWALFAVVGVVGGVRRKTRASAAQ